DFDIANGINCRANVMNVCVLKTTHDLHDRLHLTNVMEKLIAKAFTGARAFYESSDIDKLDRRRCGLLRTGNLGDLLQPWIGDGYNADVRVNCAKRIILRRRFMRACDRIEKR